MKKNLWLGGIFLVSQSICGGDITLITTPYLPDTGVFGVRVSFKEMKEGEFCVWVYDKGGRCYISKIWTQQGWKAGWNGYQRIENDTVVWGYLKLYKMPKGEYYLSVKIKNKDTLQKKVETIRIIKMKEEGGWVIGTVYKDKNFTTPYEGINILLKNKDEQVVGLYRSEDNLVEEGGEIIPGRFVIPVKAGKIEKIEMQNEEGEKVKGYVMVPLPWEVKVGKEFWVDPIYIEKIEIIPQKIEVGDTVRIKGFICNPKEKEEEGEVYIKYKNEQKEGRIKTEKLKFPPKSCTIVEGVWKVTGEGEYLIIIEVEVDKGKTRTEKKILVGMGGVRINEIMVSPKEGGEWVELINLKNEEIQMKGWELNNVKITQQRVIPPLGMIIISNSPKEVLSSLYEEIPVEVINLEEEWKYLNDYKDTIIIKDEQKVIQDILIYDVDWFPTYRKGNSLERINPTLLTQDENNWSPSISPLGGTPGRENSVYKKEIYTSTQLPISLVPKIFNPKVEKLYISYTLENTNPQVKLYIFDRCGRCIKRIVEGNPWERGSCSIVEKGKIRWVHVWEGEDEWGRVISPGIYIVYLEAKDGKTIVKEKTKLIVKR